MTHVPMSDEDREELVALQHRVDATAAEHQDALTVRNTFMNTLFNSWRADIHEIAKTIGMRRQHVHTICKGPRTGTRKPLASRRWPRRGGES